MLVTLFPCSYPWSHLITEIFYAFSELNHSIRATFETTVNYKFWKTVPNRTSLKWSLHSHIWQNCSQIYDPLGWATSVTIKAKTLLQQVWQQKTSWDEPLDDDLHDKWFSVCNDIRTCITHSYYIKNLLLTIFSKCPD